MWVPPEELDPVVLQAPTRKSVAVLGAVRPADGYLLEAVLDQLARWGKPNNNLRRLCAII